MSPLFAFLLLLPVSPETLTAHLIPTYDFTSTSSVRAYIESQATTTPIRALYIAENESHFKSDARGDLHITCKNKNSPQYGKPVTSRGVFQVSRCWFPEITDEQADDVVFITEWALPRIADRETCKMLWTTCREYFRGSYVIE